MASKYSYYIRGRQIALIEQTEYNGKYESPSKSVASGLRFEYSERPAITSDEAGLTVQADTVTEADYVQMSDYLTKALIYYLKARLAEDMQEFEQHEWYMRQFRTIVGRYEKGLSYGPRKVFPPGIQGIH